MNKPPNPARRSQSSKEATLAAALSLCQELGYARVTVEAIAARAGVSKKTIYRWWPSKGAVILEAVEHVSRTETVHANTGDVATDLHDQVTTIVELLTGPQTGSALTGLLAEAMDDTDLARQIRERLVDPRIATFDERMKRAQADGEIAASADPALFMDFLYGPIYHRLVLHLGMPDAKDLRTIVELSLQLFAPPSR